VVWTRLDQVPDRPSSCCGHSSRLTSEPWTKPPNGPEFAPRGMRPSKPTLTADLLANPITYSDARAACRNCSSRLQPSASRTRPNRSGLTCTRRSWVRPCAYQDAAGGCLPWRGSDRGSGGCRMGWTERAKRERTAPSGLVTEARRQSPNPRLGADSGSRGRFCPGPDTSAVGGASWVTGRIARSGTERGKHATDHHKTSQARRSTAARGSGRARPDVARHSFGRRADIARATFV
jgi:hypothetical protein